MWKKTNLRRRLCTCAAVVELQSVLEPEGFLAGVAFVPVLFVRLSESKKKQINK